MPKPDTDSPGRVIAHRGASRIAPENTLAAFRAAAGQGATWVEFDVSSLGDLTPVLHHDATGARCSTHPGPLSALTARDLPGIDAGAWFAPAFRGEPLATLTQALDLIESLGLSANLEMKAHGAAPGPLAEAVAQALARPWVPGRILVSSFDHGELAALRDLRPDLPLAMLWEEPEPGWADAALTLGACSVHLHYPYVSEGLLRDCRRLDLHARVYTVNDPQVMAPFRDRGLTGVITDHPPLFLDLPDWAAWAQTPLPTRHHR